MIIGAKETAGLSNNDFPEAVKRVILEQTKPGEPKKRRILFKGKLPLPVILAKFEGRPNDGKGMAETVRQWLKDQTRDGNHAG